MWAEEDRNVVCAAFTEASRLSAAYLGLLEAGLSTGDVSILIAEDSPLMETPNTEVRKVLGRLSLMQGGFTGGLRIRAVGPARSFGVSGSLVSGLIRLGIDDAEVAWLIHALADGFGVILVHSASGHEGAATKRVFADHDAARYGPRGRDGRAENRADREAKGLPAASDQSRLDAIGP